MLSLALHRQGGKMRTHLDWETWEPNSALDCTRKPEWKGTEEPFFTSPHILFPGLELGCCPTPLHTAPPPYTYTHTVFCQHRWSMSPPPTLNIYWAACGGADPISICSAKRFLCDFPFKIPRAAGCGQVCRSRYPSLSRAQARNQVKAKSTHEN